MRESINQVRGHRAIVQRIRRRSYCVAGPNSLWHLDGNHKMIKWRMVVHGAIDGFTRLTTFLKCSDNNRSSTVLESFINAISHTWPLGIGIYYYYGSCKINV